MLELPTKKFLESGKTGKVLYKGMSREKSPPWLDAGRFCFGIQPNCLNVHSYFESGLPQAKGFGSSPRVKRRINSSSLWFHFAVVTAPVVF
jgi:hypothetical protein